jgi:uncharacterized protein
MERRFDLDKDRQNIAKHRISLSRAFDMQVLNFLEDDRFDYGEARYRAWGIIDNKGYYLAYTIRDGKVRPISLRRAREKEIKRYVP